ncbi:hypothetical protein QMK19_39090 [Streptomyces sp. H10-C2]|uniref:hypothetical protein n=1 Tax=unclassified Streptomyces TaxID=2593676 RepID=UPI0024BA70A5|nr:MULTISPECIES: hypothetical protein [unclassified Streptomyces]MDJ0347210.1 hypothetical protein [Streptomyces sp. PH10-H1]MDJ0375442.1 hypothetical protein [Streptomyces sp. H10-C2]
MTHSVRRRPEGRYQCTACRAAWPTEGDALRSAVACPGEPLAHGLTREHRVFPKSGDRSCGSWFCEEPDPSHYHGPDPFCDVQNCRYCCHGCDCAVCTGTLHAPHLTILEDIPEHELAQTPKRRNVRLTTEFHTLMGDLSAGEHVTATGTDTRGHQVTRAGYLLAAPEIVTARRNGCPAKALRLCVGAKGTDPSERTTWTTLFADEGTVERTPEPEAGSWSNTELRFVPGVRASSHTTRILYGGKGGARSTGPNRSAAVSVVYTDEGFYALWDPATDTTHALIKLSNKIWWAQLPMETTPDTASSCGERGAGQPTSTAAGS